MEKKLNSLKGNIESLILGVGGVNEYHAQIVTRAIIDLLKQEGFIKLEGELDESEDGPEGN